MKLRFADIPKFTQRPSYHVNIGIDYFEEWLNSHIEQGLQLEPDFQRCHVWTEEQQIKYIEYILRGGSSGKEFYFNHTNGMCSLLKKPGEFVCVDGLQRITAILRFLHNEIPVFGVYLKDFEDKLRMADVMFSVWVNDLKTKKLVLIWYVEMNSGGTPHTNNEIERVKKMIEDEK